MRRLRFSISPETNTLQEALLIGNIKIAVDYYLWRVHFSIADYRFPGSCSIFANGHHKFSFENWRHHSCSSYRATEGGHGRLQSVFSYLLNACQRSFYFARIPSSSGKLLCKLSSSVGNLTVAYIFSLLKLCHSKNVNYNLARSRRLLLARCFLVSLIYHLSCNSFLLPVSRCQEFKILSALSNVESNDTHIHSNYFMQKL